MYSKIIKRILDIIISLLGLVCLSWLFIIIIIAIEIDDPGSVFFTQKRIGKNKKTFTLLKFRSMKVSAPHETPTSELENPGSYITKVGGVLRKFSLDELPQFFNILVGDMSVVGPRPVLWNQFNLIAERDKYGANDIRPGLTGLAQINGRDELTDEKKAAYDGEYTKNISFAMDFKCFFGTFSKVIRSDGVVEGKK